MKYIVIILTIFIIDAALPSSGNELKAQVAERRVKKNKTRRQVKRTTKRRVRRKVTRRAHYRYRGLPRWRATVTSLPARTIIIKRNGVAFRYYEGIFYQSAGTNFIVVRPAIGIRVRVLPKARRRILINNTTYFYYYGTYYKPVNDGSEYEVVDAPEGALVDALPEGYEIKEINGTEYYVLDDVYYQEVETDEIDSGIGYEVVNI